MSKKQPGHWRILARHTDWILDAKITESSHSETELHRFTATICGWRNWKIATSEPYTRLVAEQVIAKVRAIRDRIQAGDESVFDEPNVFVELKADPELRAQGEETIRRLMAFVQPVQSLEAR